MSDNEEQSRWLLRAAEQMGALEGVETEVLTDGRIALAISYGGDSRKLVLACAEAEYRDLKIQFNRIREALTELGIREGQTFVAPKRSRRPLSPEMLAARAKQEQAFNAWQDMWRVLRESERSLDVEYEIVQMIDYY